MRETIDGVLADSAMLRRARASVAGAVVVLDVPEAPTEARRGWPSDVANDERFWLRGRTSGCCSRGRVAPGSESSRRLAESVFSPRPSPGSRRGGAKSLAYASWLCAIAVSEGDVTSVVEMVWRAGLGCLRPFVDMDSDSWSAGSLLRKLRRDVDVDVSGVGAAGFSRGILVGVRMRRSVGEEPVPGGNAALRSNGRLKADGEPAMVGRFVLLDSTSRLTRVAGASDGRRGVDDSSWRSRSAMRSQGMRRH